MSQACGLSRRVIASAIREIEAGAILPAGRVRRAGGGQRRLTQWDPGLLDRLEAVIADHTRGHPESPLPLNL